MPVLTFKVSEEEERTIRAKARAAKAESLSAFLREFVLKSAPAKPKILRKIHPVSGLPYNAASGRKVTDEEIRAALADYP